ncbi:hypothetical protein QFZ27_005044 [Inquilinus ginsengisoli]|uniref:hypothetical protein n=1 Tax=Inquilinus ginsengisoli TaxID=363840 RepID=UPI003D19BACB
MGLDDPSQTFIGPDSECDDIQLICRLAIHIDHKDVLGAFWSMEGVDIAFSRRSFIEIQSMKFPQVSCGSESLDHRLDVLVDLELIVSVAGMDNEIRHRYGPRKLESRQSGLHCDPALL